MEYITKINKRTGQNHYYTVVPNKSAQGGFFRKIIRTHRAFIRHARVHKEKGGVRFLLEIKSMHGENIS